MAALKTQPNEGDVEAFLESIEHPTRKADGLAMLRIMREETGESPRMWGASIVGFGDYHYKYESGREGDWFRTGFSPRKKSLTVYIMPGFNRYADLMAKLGKHKTGKGCLYINKLADVDEQVLRQLIRESYQYIGEKYK